MKLSEFIEHHTDTMFKGRVAGWAMKLMRDDENLSWDEAVRAAYILIRGKPIYEEMINAALADGKHVPKNILSELQRL